MSREGGGIPLSSPEAGAIHRRDAVVIVIHGAGWGGTERHVRGLLAGLARSTWRVHLVASEEGPLLREAEAHGVVTHRVPRPDPVSYLRHLGSLFRAIRPAVVHAHSGRLPCLAARQAGVPAVLETRHGLPERVIPVYQWVPPLRRWEAWKSRLAHRTLAVCQADADWLVAAGLPTERIRVVANGLPAPAPLRTSRTEARRNWGLPEEAALIGFVGRLTPQKAPSRFLETLAGFAKQAASEPGEGGPRDVRGVVCGDGPLLGSLVKLSEAWGIADRVLWLGARRDSADLLPALDLLLLPSTWEGAPYVVLEALQAGTPLLSTPVGGVPELLAGPLLGRGCLPWEASAWRRRAGEVLAAGCERAAWAEAAQARARDFPEERTVRGVEEAYRELLGLAGDGCLSRRPDGC